MTTKNRIRYAADFASWILVLIPVLSDIIGLFSFFVPSISAWMDKQVDSSAHGLIYAILNSVLLFSIILLVERRSKNRIERTSRCIEGYNKLLKKYSEYLIEFDDRCEKIQTVDSLYKETTECLKTIVDESKEILCDLTAEKIRVCVKSFPTRYSHKDISQMELVTFCRSDKSIHESERERGYRIKVSENTDFKSIIGESYPYFAYNGLTSYSKNQNSNYENSSKRWEKKYNATIP